MSLRDSSTLSSAFSFNGAATCSLRNAEDKAAINAYTDPSMGPQHVRCGMYAWLQLSRDCWILQWGRNMFVAEWLAQMTRCLEAYSPFNGAATCSLRNENAATEFYNKVMAFNGAATCSLRNAAYGLFCLLGAPPSMGPQHVRCGMSHGG